MSALTIIFTLVFLFVFMVLAFFKPKYGLFLLLISRPIIDNIAPLRFTQIPILGINALQTIGIVLPAILLFICLIKKLDAAQPAVYFFKNSHANYYLLFLIFCLPAVLVSNKPLLMGGDWLRFITLWAILLFSLNFISTREDMREVFFVIVLSSIYPLFRFTLDFGMGNSVIIGEVRRYTAGYFTMIEIASLLTCFLPAYLYFIYEQNLKMRKYLMVAGTLFLFFCISTTLFRTAIIAFVSILFTVLLLRKQYAILLSIVFMLMIASVFSPAIQGKFSPAISAILNLDSLFTNRQTKFDVLMSGRFGMYRELTWILLHKNSLYNMFLGFGYDIPLKEFWINNAHNGFFQIAYRFSLLAAISFYLFIISSLFSGLKKRRYLSAQITMSFVFGLFIVSIVGAPFDNVRYLWYLGVYMGILLNDNNFQPNTQSPASDYSNALTEKENKYFF